jgi:periplasmic protein TonB
MTARNPLFEFMPYGAPELLAAQRPNLLRALVLASGLALAMFALVQTLGLSVPIRPIELPIVRLPAVTVAQPPSIIDPRIPALPSVNPTPPKGPAYPVVVDDAPPAVVETGDLGAHRDEGFGDVSNPFVTREGPVAIVEDKPPVRGEWVYVDEAPAAVKLVKPIYPEMARDLGIEGPVYVHMLVGKDGRVMRAEVDEKIAVPLLNEAALTAARQWVFKPALAQGHPVMVWVGERFVFTLH